jgi:hypothetical protein
MKDDRNEYQQDHEKDDLLIRCWADEQEPFPIHQCPMTRCPKNLAET